MRMARFVGRHPFFKEGGSGCLKTRRLWELRRSAIFTLSVDVGRMASGEVLNDVQFLGGCIVAHLLVECLEEGGQRVIRDVFHQLLHVG